MDKQQGNFLESVSRRNALKLFAAATSIAGLPGCSSAGAKRTAVVIGAGIAGLSAAYDLRKAGFNVRVFEKWDFVGGRMRDAQMGPLYLAPHALGVLEANAQMFALADELGIKGQLQGTELSDAYMVDNGHGIYETALRFQPDEIAKIPGISSETIQKLPILQTDLVRIKSKVDPCFLASGAAYDDETVSAYYERMVGPKAAQEIVDYWIDVVLAAWGWPAAETSKIAILPWLAQQQARTVTPRGGIGVLTRKLGSVLPVETQTTVRYISPPGSDGRHAIHYLAPDLTRAEVTPDVVVCATEGKYITELVQGLTQRQNQFFRSIDFTKAVATTFVMRDGAVVERGQGGFIPKHPDPLKRRVNSWWAQGAKPGERGQPATVGITLAREEVPAWQASGETQPDYCRKILKAIYPALVEADIIDAVTRGCDDLIYMPQGYIRSMAELVRDQESSRRGLYFAGEFFAGAHTGAACASGRKAASTIIRHWL